MALDLKPGQVLAKGVCRHLRHRDFCTLEEFAPVPGLRVDVFALGPKGEMWIVECKSSRTDFMSDSKWEGYLPYCDRFFWAVGTNFPVELLPGMTGIFVADSYDAEIIRMCEESKLPAARRKKLAVKFGRTAADRLSAAREAANAQRYRMPGGTMQGRGGAA